MDATWELASNKFKRNVRSVLRLIDFDRVIIEEVVNRLEALEKDLEERHVHSGLTVVRNHLQSLRNIKSADSLRPAYEVMFNQCVVLLVSYFDSGTHGVFRDAVTTALEQNRDVPVTRRELTVSWHSLESSDAGRAAAFAERLLSQLKTSFQDMKSIVTVFSEHLDIDIKRGPITNDIIVGQAARNAIVHAGGVVDRQMLKQIDKAYPRTLMVEPPSVGEPLRFRPADIMTLSDQMERYVDALCDMASQRLGSRATPPAVGE